jgi:hypothetical protein
MIQWLRMRKENDYETVLRALKSSDLHAVIWELEAVELRTADTALRTYLRLVIGFLNSPVHQDAKNMRLPVRLPLNSPSIKPLVAYCRRGAARAQHHS